MTKLQDRSIAGDAHPEWTMTTTQAEDGFPSMTFTDPDGETYEVSLEIVDGTLRVASRIPGQEEASVVHMTTTQTWFSPSQAPGVMIDSAGSRFPADNFVPRQSFVQSVRPTRVASRILRDWKLEAGLSVEPAFAGEWIVEHSPVDFENIQDVTVIDPIGRTYHLFSRIERDVLTMVALDQGNGLGVLLRRNPIGTTIGPLSSRHADRTPVSFASTDTGDAKLSTELDGSGPRIVARSASRANDMESSDVEASAWLEIDRGCLRVLFYTPEHEEPCVVTFGHSEIAIRDPRGPKLDGSLGVVYDATSSRPLPLAGVDFRREMPVAPVVPTIHP